MKRSGGYVPFVRKSGLYSVPPVLRRSGTCSAVWVREPDRLPGPLGFAGSRDALTVIESPHFATRKPICN